MQRMKLKYVNIFYLFGGATSHSDVYEWKHASEIVKYGIHNFYSKKDSVLKYLHTPEQFGQPADLHPDTLPELIRTASRFIFGQF